MIDTLQVDAGISYIDNEPPGRVSTIPLYEETYVLVCGEDGPLAGRDEVSWADLADLPLCLLTPDMQNRRIVNRHPFDAGIAPKTLAESNSTVVLMSFVTHGGGATVLPALLAEFLAIGRRIRRIPIAQQAPPYHVGLIATFVEPHTPVIEAHLSAAWTLPQTFR